MNPLNGLLGCAGIWRGTNRLEDPHIKSPEDSFATALVSPMLGGRFVRIDYTWVFYGDSQEGSILFCHEKKSDLVTAYWIDTWHLDDKVMICTGIPAEGELNVLGSYATPTGPDWGWRIIVTPNEGKTFTIKMFNVEPEGRELFAVESQFKRGEG